MDSESIDSEFSIIDALSSDEQSHDTRQSLFWEKPIKLTKKTVNHKVFFYSIKLIDGKLTVKFKTNKKIVPNRADTICLLNNYNNDLFLLSVPVPANGSKRDFTVFFKVNKYKLPPKCRLFYKTTEGENLDYAFFSIDNNIKMLEDDSSLAAGISLEVPSSTSDDEANDDSEDWDSITNFRSIQPEMNPVKKLSKYEIPVLAFETDLKNSTNDMQKERDKLLRTHEENFETELENSTNDVQKEREKLLRTHEENIKLRKDLKSFREDSMDAEKEKEAILHHNEELQTELSQMKFRVSYLDKQLTTAKRSSEAANKYAVELKRRFQVENEVNLEKNRLLKQETKRLRKRQEMFMYELPRRSLDSSDTDSRHVSRTVSSSSLNEFSTVLEEKMEKIATNFTQQIWQMQESIVKLLPESKKEDIIDNPVQPDSVVKPCSEDVVIPTTEDSLEHEVENTQAKVVDVKNEIWDQYYRDMARPLFLGTRVNVTNDEISLPTVSSIDMSNFYPSIPVSLSSESTSTTDEQNDDISSTPETFHCPLCDFSVNGPYSNIEEHFSNLHIDKKCPFCTYTVQWYEDEQLNCHVQAHLDEEDAKSKSSRGWIFSSLNFD